MAKHLLLTFYLTVLFVPYQAFADNHDDVTIRVMQMDEVTPDSVINRIELPAFETDVTIEAEMSHHEPEGFAGEIDSMGFEAEVEVQGMQNEISTKGHGR